MAVVCIMAIRLMFLLCVVRSSMRAPALMEERIAQIVANTAMNCSRNSEPHAHAAGFPRRPSLRSWPSPKQFLFVATAVARQ
jgi:hypothetical protein